MRIVKVALAVVALALPAASARAQTHEVTAKPADGAFAAPVEARTELAKDQGWNAKWALLFQLNNIFMNAKFIDNFDVGAGVQYFLSPEMAARFGVSFGRVSDNPATQVKTQTQTAGENVTTYTMDPTTAANSGGGIDTGRANTTGIIAPTSTTTFDVRADMLYRLLPTAVAPYVGGGLYYDVRQDSVDFKDDVTSSAQTIETHAWDRTQRLGLRGILGAEWRLHPNFSIFAEYALSIDIVTQRSFQNDTVKTDTTADQSTVSRKTYSSGSPAWLTAGTALTQAGQLGLAVHF